jgi:hypothetical protein
MGLLDAILPSFLAPVANAVNTVVDRLVPDNNAAQKLKDEIALELAQANVKGQLAQLDINKTEAASSSIFVAGGRPFIIWVGGAGFAVQYVLIPFLAYVYALLGYTAPEPIHLDPVLNEVLFGVLGLTVGARTYEKVKGVAS